MDWGLKNRMSRVFKPKTGKTVMLAVDHGYFQGPTTRLENPRKTITPLVPYADSLMLTRGTLRNCVDAVAEVPIVLRVSGGPSILSELSNEEITTSVKEAVRLNAAGVGMSIFVGAPTKIDIPTPAAFKRTASLTEVVISSFESSDKMLGPPETLKTIGTSATASTQFLKVPRVSIKESA